MLAAVISGTAWTTAMGLVTGLCGSLLVVRTGIKWVWHLIGRAVHG